VDFAEELIREDRYVGLLQSSGLEDVQDFRARNGLRDDLPYRLAPSW
jgi:hypothetical protein